MQKKCYSLKKSFLILVLIPAIMLLVLAPLNERYNGFKERFGSEYLKIESTQKKHISPYRNLCIDNNTEEENKKCIIGSPNSNKKAFLIGDSNSNHFWSFVDVLVKDARIFIVVNGTSSCLTLPGIYQYDWWYFKNRTYQKYHNDTKFYYDKIRQEKFSFVIIGEAWMNYASDNVINNIGDERSTYLSRERIKVAMREAMNVITKSGSKPVIINDYLYYAS